MIFNESNKQTFILTSKILVRIKTNNIFGRIYMNKI